MLQFGTSGIRGPVSDVVTPEAVVRVARAVAAEGETFALGCDGRETSPALIRAAAAGLAAGGADVECLGCVPTPALAFASQGRHGVMITASHNPPGDNGIKIFADGSEIDRPDERRIEERMAGDDPAASWDAWGSIETGLVLDAYREAVTTYLEPFGRPPDDISVVIDCGTGVAATVAPSLLRSLGVTLRTINGTIDGSFPARPSKPTRETARTLRSFVSAGPADIGLAFDGDADRLVVVDAGGDVVHEDTVVAILAAAYTARATVDDPVVLTTPNASERIDERVADAGGRVERTSLGALHAGMARVRAESDPDTSVVFAAEPWKHLHPGFGGWIDALVSAGLLVTLLGEADLDTLRGPVPERPYRKISIDCPDDRKASVIARLAERLPERFPEATRATETDGFRLSFADSGWLLVRPSGTEPKIRVYVEAPEADRIAERVRSLVAATLEESG